MNHRKSHSYSGSVGGSVPFSWEEKPGISKLSPGRSQICSKKQNESDVLQQPLHKSFSSHFHSPLNYKKMGSYDFDVKISPPPPPSRRSPSMKKGLREGSVRCQDHDPFAAAIEECTKNHVTSLGRRDPSNGIKKYMGFIKYYRNHSIIPSCKKACDVKEGNLVRLLDLPPLVPRGANRNQAR